MKKNILILTQFYYPSVNGGGPVQSMLNMVNQLGDIYNFYVITSDRDLNCNIPYANIITGQFVKYNNVEVFYNNGALKLKNFLRILKFKQIDIIYLNSFFSFRYSIKPFLSVTTKLNNLKVIIAPRGEFSPGALNIKKTKKHFFINTIARILPYKKVHWQSTSELETSHIRKIFGEKCEIVLARNISNNNAIELLNPKYKEKGSIHLVFISRISKKKNLHFALNVLKRVINYNIYFDIYGPIEDEIYWMNCMKLINEMPNNVYVKYKGILINSKVREVFSNYNAFFFPTLGENYGHVIYEALSSNCPVILSDQTPWEAIVNDNAGWIKSLENLENFVSLINYLSSLNNEDYQQYILGTRIFIEKYNQTIDFKDEYQKLFSD